MKYLLFCASLLFILACGNQEQSTPTLVKETPSKKEVPSVRDLVDTNLFETFEYEEGDTTYLMKKYFICFLKQGKNRNQSEAEATKIQENHLAYMGKLAEEQKICIAGPFDDDGAIRGITIYSVPTLEDAQQLANNDPAVKAGRLEVEVHPWWAAVGSTLY